jgi:hypothetical protein
MVTREHIISEAKRLFERDGRSPGSDRFKCETGVKKHEWQRFFARWNDVLREAGIPENQLQARYPVEELLKKYISLARELGRLPTSGDIRVKAHALAGFPHDDSFIRGLGRKSERVQRLLKYCQGRDGFEDIIRMCEEYVPRAHTASDEVTSDPDFGFVYLLKSGRFYKIGRTLQAVENTNWRYSFPRNPARYMSSRPTIQPV